jgi:hypothetical protein
VISYQIRLLGVVNDCYQELKKAVGLTPTSYTVLDFITGVRFTTLLAFKGTN